VSKILIETVRRARRLIVAVVGFTLIACGVVMIVTPGPGWLVIFLGLSALAAEFVWARRLLMRFREKSRQMGEAVFGASKSR
jgi:uncharacterized protein (TIGR02611 family)